ncbi:MAG: transporter substrate-binding domain-containing protein, partial [Duodenibacillus sp.]|nr:transporter substrate-binding domain-containing protein [Duodenibacillus sp.]
MHRRAFSRILCAAGLALLALGQACPAAASPKGFAVGLDASFAPFGFQDEQGAFTGFDVELLQAVAARKGAAVKFCHIPFDELVVALKSGVIDVIAGDFTVTARRARDLWFSRPTCSAGQGLLV